MIQYFNRLDYQQSLDSSNHSQLSEQQDNCTDLSGLFLHAKVYAIAEKYAIGGLKDLAVTKFRTTAKTVWDAGDFLDAASEAYTSTIDTDRGLRDVILGVFAEHVALLDHDEAKSLVKRLGSLAFDLLVHFHQ
ncbi:BTB/POZ domain-containing protein, partial [Colletotrichum higginsianum]